MSYFGSIFFLTGLKWPCTGDEDILHLILLTAAAPHSHTRTRKQQHTQKSQKYMRRTLPRTSPSTSLSPSGAKVNTEFVVKKKKNCYFQTCLKVAYNWFKTSYTVYFTVLPFINVKTNRSRPPKSIYVEGSKQIRFKRKIFVASKDLLLFLFNYF